MAGADFATKRPGVSSVSDPSAIHDAFRRGDFEQLRRELGDPPNFPAGCGPPAIGQILEYAIYHSPLTFVRTLLELGADPNYEATDGFPSLIAALSVRRVDQPALIDLLLDFGANLEQRGLNDYSPLHFAACANDVGSVEQLLARGADPDARTRIDDLATPLEEAEILGRKEAAKVLREWSARSRKEGR